MRMAVAAAVPVVAIFQAESVVLQSRLPSHCFTCASMKDTLASKTKLSKTFIWGFSICSFRT